MPEPKCTIFVSHISDEADLAKALKDHLLEEFPDQLEVFVSSDRTSIRAGEEWLQAVRGSLEDAAAVLVMCSEASISRPWVNFEAGGAWLAGQPLVPVCHSGLTPAELPSPLNALNGVVATSPQGLLKLHDVVSRALGLAPSGSDPTAFIRRFKALERQYQDALDLAGRIQSPAVLCAASEQYCEPAFGFDGDVALVRRAFGDAVRVERDLTLQRLRQLLRDEHFDILHLVMQVDEDDGSLIFGRVDPRTCRPVGPTSGNLSSKGFAHLLGESEVQLVVLATCRALFLAADVARVTNMVATHVGITGDEAQRWSECFYDYLRSGSSLFESADAAKEQVPVAMRLIPHHNFAFAPPEGD